MSLIKCRQLRFRLPYRSVVEWQAELDGRDPSPSDLIRLHPQIASWNISEVEQSVECLFSPERVFKSCPHYEHKGSFVYSAQPRRLTVGEAIECLEYIRLTDREDPNMVFNLALSTAAVLMRPQGVRLPAGRYERDEFIARRKAFFFDELTLGHHVELSAWFSDRIAQIREVKEFQFFWKGRPSIRVGGSKRSSETIRRENLEREIASVVGLRINYQLAQELYGDFERMFYADFTDFVFRVNLKTASAT